MDIDVALGNVFQSKQSVLKPSFFDLLEELLKDKSFAYMLLLDGGLGSTAPVFTFLEELGHDF